MQRLQQILGIALVVAAAGCTDSAADPCELDRCEGAETRAELLAQLDGFADPIATHLRASVSSAGTLAGDYRGIMNGVGELLGCAADDAASFVVLSNDDYTPKLILSNCADNATAASQFFVALGGVDGHGGTDATSIHMAAWDADAGLYRRYSTRAADGGGLSVNVEPRFCLGCHGGPEKLTTWSPLMNEMTSPWSGWNAEPGFRSQLFDDYLDPTIAASPVYRDVTDSARLRSAADLEPIIRAGIDRVTNARGKRRDSAASVDEALELLRPVFCDESVNFVSEVHGDGEIRTAAFIDPALPRLFAEAGVSGSWSWLTDATSFMSAGEPNLTLVPVRGESTVQAELNLVTRGVLTARQVLAVRAVDWRNPVDSAVRCELYRAGSERAKARPITVDTNAALVRELYADMMMGTQQISLTDWAVELNSHVQAALVPGMRATLAAKHRELSCKIATRYPITPIFPDFECP